MNFNNIEDIKTYIKKYKSLCDEFEKEFKDPEVLQYYLLSQTFLNEWKEYICYEQLLKDAPPSQNFGKNFPQYFNKDLLVEEFSSTDDELLYRNEEERCELKPKLQEEIDFQIVNKKIMDFFKADFHGKDIPRRAYILPDGRKRIEIYYKKVCLIFN